MTGIRTVLVPVDFQRHTDTLAAYAFDMATRLGARAIVVHVLTAVEYRSAYDSSTFEDFEAKNHQAAEERMASFREHWRGNGWEGDTRLLRGEAAEAIVDCARDMAVDLIIMATHGSKGLERILLGSVADRVLKRAPCPVLLFNPYRSKHLHRAGRGGGHNPPA